MTNLLEANFDPRRHIPVDGAYNIRDLGGYPTKNGGQTRWRTLFRADGISNLPTSSKDVLIDEGVKTVVDLRGTRELREEPNAFLDTHGVAYRSHNVAGDGAVSSWGDRPIPDDSSVRLSMLYTAILDKRGEALRDTLKSLAEPNALPALFHCTAGKDRTGVLSALILGIAGVPDETIIEDYVLSARFLYGTPVVPTSDLDAGPPLSFEAYQLKWAPAGAMQATLGHIENSYGGVVEYARRIGVSDSEIAAIKNAMEE